MPRISAGALKGMSLKTPQHIRVTAEKVRQALFNILGNAVEGSRVLDGFAGSGALGIEALSRGAVSVTFLERHPVCLRVLRDNLAKMPQASVAGRWDVMRGDALRALRALASHGARFDFLLLDPPYEGGWGRKTLNVVAECGILRPAGVLCLEHARANQPPPQIGPLTLTRQHWYGDTGLSFYEVREG